MIPATLFLSMLIPAAAGAVETGHPLQPRLPPKNCVEDAGLKRQIAEQQRLVLATLAEMEPRLSTGPASLGAIRRQCEDLFGDAQKCATLGAEMP